MEEEEVEHTDLFGQPVDIDDFVIGGQGHELAVYKVIRITPKMIRVAKVGAVTTSAKKGKLRYANELFKIDQALATFYLMKLKK